MIIVLVCAAMLVVGLILTARWSSIPVSMPPGERDGSAGTAALRCGWWVALATAAGAASGILVIGAGGRLVMRLLAVTAGDDAEGALTEAEETVGDITFSGTLAFMLFIGVGVGVLTGLLYVALHRWLPGGRATGLWFGVLLLVLLATRVEPLRTSNEDFDLVGPAWVSIPLFGLLAFAQGAAVAAFVGRWSRTMPLLTSWRAVPRYLPVLPLLLLSPFTAALIVVMGVAILCTKVGVYQWWSSRRVDVAGWVVLGALVVVAVPSFVTAVTDIAQRSP